MKTVVLSCAAKIIKIASKFLNLEAIKNYALNKNLLLAG